MADGGLVACPYLESSALRLWAALGERYAVGGKGAGCCPLDELNSDGPDDEDGGGGGGLGFLRTDFRGFVARANG